MFRSIRTWPFPEAAANEQPMRVMRSLAAVLGVAVLGLACAGRARAQGDVLFPGSTVEGDVLRGLGVAYRGAAVLHLNAAKARSIDADTAMRFNEYVYRSYQEYLRQRALRIAGKAAGRKASLEEIERACRRANIHDFIVSLPEGYETTVGDGGRPLSAGQARRLALARTFLRDAPLVILDEPTAHLDPRSAARVTAAIDGYRGRCTMLLISHSPELVAHCDRVVRIDDGKATGSLMEAVA